MVPYTEAFSKVEVDKADGMFPGTEFVGLWDLHGKSQDAAACI